MEEEEEAKAALMGRIQRLTKLILVSTKNALPSSVAEKPGQRRRHSFGEDEVCIELFNSVFRISTWYELPIAFRLLGFIIISSTMEIIHTTSEFGS